MVEHERTGDAMNIYLKAFTEQLDKEMKAVEGFSCSDDWLRGARCIASWAAGCAEGIENWIGGCDNCANKGLYYFVCANCVRNPDLTDEYVRVKND